MVRAAIRHELELFSRELAIDLTRQPNLRAWSAQDLQMLSDLIVNAMVSTAELMLTVEPEDEPRVVDDARRQLRLIVVGISGWRPPSRGARR